MAKKHSETKEVSAESPVAAKMIELRSGLFLNTEQIVSVRVLPEDGGSAYAVMQLTNGDKMELTREEFRAICGVEPRRPPSRVQAPRGRSA